MDYNAVKIEKLKHLAETMRQIMIEGDGDKPMKDDEVTKVLEGEPEEKEEMAEDCEEECEEEELPKKMPEIGSAIPIMSLLKKAKSAAPKAVTVESVTVSKKPDEMPFKKKKA